MIMGLLGVWYNNFYGAQSYALLPYDQVRVSFVFIILFKVDHLIGIQQKQYLFILLLRELQE